MRVGTYEVRYERSWHLRRIGVYMMELAIEDPTGSVNYAEVHYKVKHGNWWNTIGHKPSISHHTKLRGEFKTCEEAIRALVCELRMRSAAKGSREYAEAYRDRWLEGVEILDELPDGWKVKERTMTQPCGTRWACNGKSMFGGKYEQALLYVGVA